MTASAWSPNSAVVPQANVNGTVMQEPQVALEGQRTFNLQNFAYVLGTGSLKVYKNGMVLTRNEDFFEASGTQVILAESCALGDKILLEGFVGITGTASVDSALRTDVSAGGGSAIVGFIQKGATAVKQFVQDLLRERVSLSNYGTGIGKGNVAVDTAAFLAAIAAVKQAYYDKGSVCLYIPTPDVPYRINQTLDLTEVWNLTLKVGNAFFFQRQQVTDILSDNSLIHWYGDNVKPMMRLHYTFGMHGEALSLNGRGIAKIGIDIAPSTSVASVTRKISFTDLSIKNCDFGVRIGDLGSQTDNAPVILNRPYISGCMSAGILVNSGNASVNINDAFMINNGYAPSIGNAFIADGNNGGCQLNIVAGFVNVTGWTSDHDMDHPIGSAAILQSSGSLKVHGAWFDEPTKPFYKGWADRALHFNGVTHYDGGMTLASTPNSIEYSGPQAMVLQSCYLYGNVQITSGNQSSVIDNGTTFARAGATFTGDMVTTYGGLYRVGKSGANSVAMSVGGNFPTEFGPYHSATIWSEKQRPGLIRKTRGAGSYTITETIDANNAIFYTAGNAYFDADTGQWKSIAAGNCWRHSYKLGSELFEQYNAAAAGTVIAWTNTHGFIPGTGGNAIPKIQLSDRTITFEAAPPADGTGSQGSIVFALAAIAGGKIGWVCTGAGRVWKPFGLIDA